MNRGTGIAAAFVVTVIVATGTAVVMKQGVGPVPDPEECRADVGPTVSVISTEQAENASLIAAISIRRGLPPRAASIALATAFQESKLSNIDYGDRDSLGLFQQRPSQGWGTRKQVMDPEYSINAFYDALERIDGYEEMRITEAAQEVQRSGFPEAYQDHAGDARALASALTGETRPAAFSCVVRHDSSSDPTALNEAGLTKRAQAVRRMWRRPSATSHSVDSSRVARRRDIWRGRRTTKAERSTSSCARSATPTTNAVGRSPRSSSPTQTDSGFRT